MIGDIRTYDYPTWRTDTQAAGGDTVTWPFSSGLYAQYYGKPAAKFTAAGYAAAANARRIVLGTPTQTDARSTVVYVLAPQSAWAGAPQTMTTGQRIANAVFSTGDKAADTLGLPSLASIENFLKSLGKDAVLVGAVILAAVYMLKRRGR